MQHRNQNYLKCEWSLTNTKETITKRENFILKKIANECWIFPHGFRGDVAPLWNAENTVNNYVSEEVV